MQEYATLVLNINEIEELSCLDNDINDSFLEHCKECKEEYHDSCFEDLPSDTRFVGYNYNGSDDKLEEDINAEFQAIINESTVQVVKSDYVMIDCRRTFQGCYPGNQAYVDLSSPGDIMAYSLPPDCMPEEYRPFIMSVNNYKEKEWEYSHYE